MGSDEREPYRDHVSRNVTNAASPSSRGLVENVVHAESLVLLGERIEVLLEQNILGRDVGKDEIDLSLVAGGAAADDGADDLQHGRNTGTTSNHAKVTDHVGGIHEGALGAANTNRLADGERGHVLGDVTGRIGLDEEVDIAGLVVARNGSVGAHDFLGGAVGLRADGANGDVLTDGKAEDRVGGREGEAVAGRGG